MRALTVFFALIATVAGSYGGFQLMRAVGPADLSNEFGREDNAAIDGNLLQSKNFALVVEALERELGPDGRVQHLSVELLEAYATATVGDRRVRVEVDAAGRSQQRDAGEATPAGTVPVSKIDPEALDRITAAAREETGSPVERLMLQGGGRQWSVDMLRGEPDSFIANLDGKGLRLSGEPNPVPQGAAPDSLLRAKNLQPVLDAIAKEGDRVHDLTVWPERVIAVVAKGRREVNLYFGYEAELQSRDVRALTSSRGSIPLSRIDPKAIERMARHPAAKGLKNAQYAILRSDPIENTPEWLLYLSEGNERPYITANVKGRNVSWPGRQ
jgi:hypothetical protein